MYTRIPFFFEDVSSEVDTFRITNGSHVEKKIDMIIGMCSVVTQLHVDKTIMFLSLKEI